VFLRHLGMCRPRASSKRQGSPSSCVWMYVLALYVLVFVRRNTRGAEHMKSNHKLAVAVLVGILIGVAGANAIHAQQMKVPAGYVIAEVDVTDSATFQKYAEKVPATVAAFNGHYLARGGKIETVEGEPPKRVAVLAFESVEQAHAWEYSPAYEAIKPMRQSSAKSRIFIVEGIAPQ
jgi:uncharacterized protein (DUF1330 family)